MADALPHALDAEKAVLSGVLLEPSTLDAVREVVAAADFASPAHARLFETLQAIRADGEPIELTTLAARLARESKLDAVGGPLALAEIADYAATTANVSHHARTIRLRAIDREIVAAARRIAEVPDDARAHARLAELRERVAALDAGTRRDSLKSLAFSGERMLALLDRPAPPPIEAGRPAAGHLTVLLAPAMTGKTALELWLAMSRAAGVAPWPGVAARPAARVLVVSIDEAAEQVARRARSLSVFHPAGPLEQYAHHLVVVGPDREGDPEALEALRLDARGFATLARWLEEAEREGHPFAEVYLDAYADLLPLGASENSNEEATRIGGALERLAVRFGCAITLLHHVGKPKADAPKDEPGDVRFIGRGASALAAKARVVMALEVVPGAPHLRRIRTATNLGPAPKPALFQVAAENADGEALLYWRPAADVIRDPRDLLASGEAITTNDLARRLAGDDLAADREPTGDLKRLAAQLRERWREAGLVRVSNGKRGAKLIEISIGPTRLDRAETGGLVEPIATGPTGLHVVEPSVAARSSGSAAREGDQSRGPVEALPVDRLLAFLDDLREAGVLLDDDAREEIRA
jgi:hypothetical protein